MDCGFPLPRLSTATTFENTQEVSDVEEVHVNYKTGASFIGTIKNHKKVGTGIFTWPNGSKYEGPFVENHRHGKGIHIWPDGSQYEGMFVDDLRHGKGHIKWTNGESYEGMFFRDRRHGPGTYRWPDGSMYTGRFYMDRKEGYGVFTFANGDKFEGLYIDDEREGPGIMTYSNRFEDVGLWYGEKLIKICSQIENAFTLANHREFDFNPREHTLYIDLSEKDKKTPPTEESSLDVNPPIKPDIYSEDLDPRSLAINREMFDEAFFGSPEKLCNEDNSKENNASESNSNEDNSNRDNSNKDPKEDNSNKDLKEDHTNEQCAVEDNSSQNNSQEENYFKEDSSGELHLKEEKSDEDNAKSDTSNEDHLKGEDEEAKIAAWNKTPLLIEIQKSVYKHHARANEVSFDVNEVVKGIRLSSQPKGPCELASEQYLKAAMDGDVCTVECLLTNGLVHPDVADQSGHTALIGATVNWHMDIINLVLNHGGDVNKVNNEGSSALSAGTIFFYPIDCFRYNIAERYLTKAPSLEQCPSKDSDQPKGILSSKQSFGLERRMSLLNSAKHQTFMDDDNRVQGASEDSGVQNADSVGVVGSDKVIKRSQRQSALEKNTEEEKETENGPGGKSAENVPLAENGSRSGDAPAAAADGAPAKREGQDSAIDSEAEKRAEEEEPPEELLEDFESDRRVYDYKIEVSDHLIERCATQLSTNERVVSRQSRIASAGLGTARLLAIQISIQDEMKKTLDLLLRRGADPNASSVPMPVLFFAIKAADVEMVTTLLIKGASTASMLPKERGRLTPLHIACAIPGDEGVQMTKLLLDALADPDARADEDDSFLNHTLEEEWSKDVIPEESRAILGGRTPLQIACSRDDNYKQASRVVHLLLEHNANPNLLCNGFSPLALAISSGNDQAIDELLSYGADPSLRLTHGVGTALCVATSTEYEHRRNINTRIQLVDKLVKSGADMLATIPIGMKRVLGTAVDYAYYMFNQDRRIAHMPYHALTHAERETYNARRKLLAHIGGILRTKAVDQERRRLQEESQAGRRSASPSNEFVYVGAGAQVPAGRIRSKMATRQGQVTFEPGTEEVKKPAEGDIRKPLFKYCYECGRSIFVRLSACTRCKEVFYCSKACKLKAWNARHKDECIRVGGRSRSPSPTRGHSPTPATNLDKDINKKGKRILVPVHGMSKSATLASFDGCGVSGSRGSRPMTDDYLDNYSRV